ncbi:helix-turn-helix domain-containing protein [Myxococcus sp. NMCA1]|uniref:helix-turn-helix domain-containing protein n=1 Tax=Myxococcus sp. NMCA1 TaxID=2996785 RepID=UPI002285AA62|nr:helix-turn-helix domain-containing protein [Myxococcus sp. NMCA1]WAM30049.1 helix-turn-helix domain-containing protein [Myxococcus sp. NMCA1]
MVGATGFEPATTCTSRNPGSRPAVTNPSQPIANTLVSSERVTQPSHPVPQDTKILAASLLLGPAPVAPVASGSGRLLTVREVAEPLKVCRVTVYRLCERGTLPHIRISNAVRVKAEALEQFLREHPKEVP